MLAAIVKGMKNGNKIYSSAPLLERENRQQFGENKYQIP